MGLARSTVAERIELLVSNGLLVASDDRSQGRGRPSKLLQFNAQAGLVLAAHVGMSGTRVGVTDLEGNVLTSQTVDIDITLGPEVVLGRIEKEFEDALRRANASRTDVFGLGVGVPGRVELETAHGAPGSARGWDHYPIAGRLADAYAAPVYVDQDVNLLAIAEHRVRWPEAEVLLAVKVGTVIGSGIVIGGRLVRGGSGLAGEIGHTRVPSRNAECACGNRGCLNAVAGGGALVLALAGQGLAVASTRDVVRLALDGVVLAGQAIRQAGREIGEVLAGAINLLNPDVITVWGYLADAGDQLFAGMRESIFRSGVPASTQHVRLERSSLGEDAGIRGAATTVIEQALLPDAVDRYVLEATTSNM